MTPEEFMKLMYLVAECGSYCDTSSDNTPENAIEDQDMNPLVDQDGNYLVGQGE